MTSLSPSSFVFECFVPVITESESNASDMEHWSSKHKRHKAQKELVAWTIQAAFSKLNVPFVMRKSTHRRPPSPYQKVPQALCDGPLVVHLIRHAPLKLDSDNIEGALKHVRDSVAIALGRDDGHRDEIDWREKEQRTDARKIGVLIRIYSVLVVTMGRKQRILRLLENNNRRELVSLIAGKCEFLDAEDLANLFVDLEDKCNGQRSVG